MLDLTQTIWNKKVVFFFSQKLFIIIREAFQPSMMSKELLIAQALFKGGPKPRLPLTIYLLLFAAINSVQKPKYKGG